MRLAKRCRMLLGMLGVGILSGCASIPEEKQVTTLYMEGIEYPKRESSYMACALGAARYLGYAQSEAWIYGSCGMAFFSHVTPKGLCWSYPTDWNSHECMPLLRNAGIALDEVPAPDGNRPGAIKELIRKGVPVSAWSGGIVDEEVLLVGYSDTPQGETVEYLFLNPVEKNQFHPWGRVGPATQYSLVPPVDDRTTVKMGLQCAVDMNRDTRHFSPRSSMVMGYEALRVMADLLTEKQELGGEFGYNIQVWEECRRNAAAFLGEANTRLADDRLSARFEEAAKHAAIVHNELKAIVDTFKTAGVPGGRHDEYARHLRKAHDAEKKAIETIEAILALME